MSGRLALVFSLTCIPLSASAQAEDRAPALRVQLRVERTRDARLFERLRGQTSDLPIVLERYPASHALGSFEEGSANAFARCREHGADAVVWTTPTQGDPAASWTVALATCQDDKVLTRQINATRPALAGSEATRSGALEVAALVLRGALSVLARSGARPVLTEAGDDAADATSAQAASAAPNASAAQHVARASAGTELPSANADERTPAKRAASARAELQGMRRADAMAPKPATAAGAGAPHDVREEARERAGVPDDRTAADERAGAPALDAGEDIGPPLDARPHDVNGLAMLGWAHTWDGLGASGQPAVAGTLALGGSRFQLGVTASFALGTTVEDRYATLTLARHSVGGEWRQRLWRHPVWSLSAGIDAGSVLYRRETRAHSDLLTVRPPTRSAAILVSPFNSIARRIGPLWIALSAALDILPRPPRFAYRLADGSEQRAIRLWSASPRLALSLSAGRP